MATDVNDLIFKIPVAERTAFKNKVSAIASRLNAPFTSLMAIMDLESAGTFDPSIRNKYGYVGLIQFGNAAARDLGTTTDALQKMSRLEQLDYVERYFNLKRRTYGELTNFVDLYLAVFYPEGIREKDPNKPFTPANVELANPALRGADGRITKNSIRAAYEKRYLGLFEKAIEYAKKNIGFVVLGSVLLLLAIIALYIELYRGKSVIGEIKKAVT